jgi:hypothetical protein
MSCMKDRNEYWKECSATGFWNTRFISNLKETNWDQLE